MSQPQSPAKLPFGTLSNTAGQSQGGGAGASSSKTEHPSSVALSGNGGGDANGNAAAGAPVVAAVDPNWSIRPPNAY